MSANAIARAKENRAAPEEICQAVMTHCDTLPVRAQTLTILKGIVAIRTIPRKPAIPAADQIARVFLTLPARLTIEAAFRHP
jgi:hypothetical protein